MAKKIKPKKKTTKQPDAPSESTVDTVLKNVEASMLVLSTRKDVDAATALGKLGRLHSQMRAEERKAEKEERRAAADMTMQSVLVWAKTLSPAERAECARSIIAIDEKRSGLS